MFIGAKNNTKEEEKMRKKLLFCLLSVLLVFSFTACSGGGKDGSSSKGDAKSSSGIEWPDGTGKKQLPDNPPGEIKSISQDEVYPLYATLSSVSLSEYNKYVAACREKGFNKRIYLLENDDDCDFNGYNVKTLYKVYLNYNKKEKEMGVSLEEIAEYEKKDLGIKSTEATTKATTEATTAKKKTSSGVRDSFKKAMASYEKFFDKYVKFMESYDSSDSSQLTEYTELMTQYTDTMDKMNKMGDEEMSDEELKLYTETTARITKKLADVATP